MKKYLFSLLLLMMVTTTAFPNAAMPGYWNTGAGQTFIPAFARDAQFLGAIQMKSEAIRIQLYPGFAVVKGDYWMQNLTDSAFTMTCGFPINSGVDHPDIYSVLFNDLFQLQVLVNGQSAPIQKLDTYNDSLPDFTERLFSTENWYIWETHFPADTLTHFTIYYMVLTNDAGLREGYNVEREPGFSYILETGKAWGNRIEKGSIRMQLMDGLEEDDIKGVLPIGRFKSNGLGDLEWNFTNLEPEPTDNVVVRYGEKIENFDFDAIEAGFQNYYQAIEEMDRNWKGSENFAPFEKADFDVTNTMGWSILGIALVIILLPVFLILLIVILLRNRKRKKQQMAQ